MNAAERPLDPLPTLKLKLGVVILAAVAVTVVVFWAGIKPRPVAVAERRDRRASSRSSWCGSCRAG